MKFGMPTKQIELARLIDPHVPLYKATNLSLGVAVLDHALHEFGMLRVRRAVLLRTEANDGQQILNLAEHPLFDYIAKFSIPSCPRSRSRPELRIPRTSATRW